MQKLCKNFAIIEAAKMKHPIWLKPVSLEKSLTFNYI